MGKVTQATIDSFDGDKHAALVFMDRYAAGSETTWGECVDRLMTAVDDTQVSIGKNILGNRVMKNLAELLTTRKFIPGGRILSTLGTNKKQTIYNCITLPRPEDSIEGIMKTAAEIGLALKSGAGLGVRLDSLRPKGSEVKDSLGRSSGSVSFGSVFNEVASTINQGGSRRGAVLLGHRFNHPDVEDFMSIKDDLNKLNCCNLTVYARNKEIEENPELFRKLCEHAWKTGEPGILFLDKAESLFNESVRSKISERPAKNSVKFEGVNACSEVLLHPYGCCLLGSLNLGVADVEMIDNYAYSANMFLNLCHEYAFLNNSFPLPECQVATHRTRKVGLGVMGLAHYFIRNKIVYGSEESLQSASTVFSLMRRGSAYASKNFAEKAGMHYDCTFNGRANMDLLACPPTGTTHILAGTSNGIEPVFRKEFTRTDKTGVHTLRDKYANSEFCITADEIDPIDRVKLQAAIQKEIDNGISSTVNLPASATVDDVEKIFRTAMTLGCVSITVYRDGCRSGVLNEINKDKVVTEKPKEKAFNRPYKLIGQSYKYKFGGQNLYVNVNVDQAGNPIEVFVNAPGINEQWSKATTILLSKLLQTGYNPIRIMKKLAAIEQGIPSYTGGSIIKSQPGAVADAIEDVIKDMEPENLHLETSEVKQTNKTCQQCGNEVQQVGRCLSCPICGWTTC